MCAVFKRDEHVDKFLDLLNNQHQNLKFTVERSVGSLPFLDVEIILEADNNIETRIFRKQTNTDVLLNFNSVAPDSWKRGLIKCLFHRAKSICSSKLILDKEFTKISEIFRKNEYPEWFVRRERMNFERHMDEVQKKPSQIEETKNKWNYMLTLPYVGRDTVRLGKRLKSCFNRLFSVELKIVYKNTKVGDYFTLKDRTPSLFASNVVYRFRCSVDGDTSYIGVTTRQLFERIAEHRDPKRLSAVQSHLAICEDCCNVPNFSRLFSVMKRCKTQREARAMEVMLISEYHPSLNIQLGECRGQSFLLKVYR